MKAGLAIEELAAEIMRQNEIKEDYVVNSQSLLMECYYSEMFLRVMDAEGLDRLEPMSLTDNAHRQIGARLGIPSKYYSRMLEEGRELLTQNVNYCFRQNPEQRMLRVMEGKVRAFLSNRYLRIDNHEVVCAVMPVIGEIPNVQFASNQITENHLYMKVVNPNMQREIAPGKTVQAGMVVCNSETGLGTFYVSPMIYCPELEFGMITDVGKVKRTHSGPTYRTITHSLRGYVHRSEMRSTRKPSKKRWQECKRQSMHTSTKPTCLTSLTLPQRNSVLPKRKNRAYCST